MEDLAKEKDVVIYFSHKDKGKGKMSPTKGEKSKKPSTEGGLDEELIEQELDAYIEQGENVGGEFPLNKDVTLRQDVLSKHLAELLVSIITNYLYEDMFLIVINKDLIYNLKYILMKDEQQDPLPWVPLCRLLELEKARQVSREPKRIKPLQDNFLIE